MRTLITTLASFAMLAAVAPSLQAQDRTEVTGRWEGALEVQGTVLRLVFEISATDDGYSTTVSSIDQGNAEIPVESTVIDGRDVMLDIPAIQGEYVGTLSDDGASIDGMWTQGPNSLPLLLKKATTPTEVQP